MIVLPEIHRIYRETMAQTKGGVPLQKNSALWVVRYEAWVVLLNETNAIDHGVVAIPGQGRRIMNLPVRLTIADDPDTPAVQLVMEPAFVPRRVTR